MPRNTAREFDFDRFLAIEADEHREAFESFVRDLNTPFRAVLAIWENSIRAGGKLIVFGNGGSAGNAEHIAAELTIRYAQDREAIAAVALSAGSSAVTAAANDYGFERVFSRQIEALGRPGDVAVGLSTSGASPNVLRGLREARSRGLATTGFIGGKANMMHELCDAAIVVPSTITARIQEMHLLVTHMLCKALEQRLGLVE
jgi:D-sedoheptulose 7-phosphate isomerase